MPPRLSHATACSALHHFVIVMAVCAVSLVVSTLFYCIGEGLLLSVPQESDRAGSLLGGGDKNWPAAAATGFGPGSVQGPVATTQVRALNSNDIVDSYSRQPQ